MAKLQIKSDNLTPFGGIFYVLDMFDKHLGWLIDHKLGKRSQFRGFQYSEIFRAMFSICFCGGSCIEDLNTFLMDTLCQRPGTRVPSPDTVLRGISELATDNITYTSSRGNDYEVNTADALNELLVDMLVALGQIVPGDTMDFDFDHELLEAGKYDAQWTYKKFAGYSPAVAMLGSYIIGVENRDGNTPVTFMQEETLERVFRRIIAAGIRIGRARMDCGSYTRKVVEMCLRYCDKFYIRAEHCQSITGLVNDPLRTDWKTVEINNERYEVRSFPFYKFDGIRHLRLVVQRRMRRQGDIFNGMYDYRCILTNDWDMEDEQVIEYYNQRGGKERALDQMNNDFAWKHLPKSFMNENAVFMLITAMCRNFYLFIIDDRDMRDFGIGPNSRMKRFVFRFISVPAKWVVRARQNVLVMHTRRPYRKLWKASG